VVASLNWTFYSIARNNEVGAVVFSRPLNEWFGKYFEERKAQGNARANADKVPEPRKAAPLKPADFPELKELPVADVKPIPNRLFYPAVHDAIIHSKKSVTVLQRSINLYTSPPQGDERSRLPGGPASETNVLAEDLVAAKTRGVDVKVILDQEEGREDPENNEAAAFFRSHGVTVLRDALTTQTHAKLVVIDDDKVILGSTNWTRPALENGNEASILVTSREVNKVYQDYVASILRSAAPYQAISRSVWDTPATPAKARD
jgi:phosphatidylserine/phosphatidylglycerophosphate/cardiolipin synthase-like enzyme